MGCVVLPRLCDRGAHVLTSPRSQAIVVTTDKAREQLHNFAEARAGKVIHARLRLRAGMRHAQQAA